MKRNERFFWEMEDLFNRCRKIVSGRLKLFCMVSDKDFNGFDFQPPISKGTMTPTTLGLLCFLFLMGGCDGWNKTENNQDYSFQDSLSAAPSRITVLENLPDSLQPQKRWLKDTFPPKTIIVPNRKKEEYVYRDGELATQNITSPSIYQRPYLKNEKGQPILDLEGNYYFMGQGGISHFTSYTTDDGLGLDNITSSIMDGTGNLWFGTWGGGISKFDGLSFTNYTTANGLSNNLVHCLAEDLKGNIWIGTDGGGISRYDGYSFTNLTKAQGLPNDIVYDITADRNGNLWIATGEGGASKFDGIGFSNYNLESGLPGNSIIKIAEDKNGHIWFGTGSDGVSRYDGISFTHFTTADGLADNEIFCITVDSFGNIWFGTRGGGASKYQESLDRRGKGFFTNYTTADGLGHAEIWNIKEDQQGNIWFATGGGGISKFDGKSFTNFTTAQGLAKNVVYSITEDASGYLWFGTAGGGLSLYHGTAFSNFTTEQGLPKNGVFSILEDAKGNFWFGTDGGGLSKYDGKTFTNFSTNQGLAHPLVISSAKDKFGNLWFGTGGGGVSVYQERSNGAQNSSFTTFNSNHGLQNDVVYAIKEDHAGNLWFGTGGGGLVKYDGNVMPVGQAGFTSFSTSQGLASNVVHSIFEDSKENLWIGTGGGGVSKFDGKSFTNFTTAQGLSNNIVWGIMEDKIGNLWFGTQGGGVSRYDGQNFSTFTTKEGLVDDTVYDLLADQEGNIFIGTNRGFTVVPAHATALPFLDMGTSLEYFNTSFGYPVKDINTGVYLDRKGIIWAGNGSDKIALVRFDYRALAKNRKKPAIKIKSISLNEKNTRWNSFLSGRSKFDEKIGSESIRYLGDEERVLGNINNSYKGLFQPKNMGRVKFSSISRFDNVPEKLVLPYTQNQITIDFGTDELVRPNLIEYKYILEGYNNNWSSNLKKNSATFGNIWEGDYAFKVMARYTGPSEDGGNEWSTPAIYRFSVLPPWHRSWWAYFLYGVFFLVVIRRVHVFQQAKTLRKERDRVQERELKQAKEIEKAYEKLKATQAQLIQKEKMASLGELTAGIAHEIQNPLNFVNNFSEVSSELIDEMNEELEKGDIEEAKFISKDIKENLKKITHHGKRADAIVKGMLAHSRTSTGQKVPTDMNALCEEYLNLSYHGLRTKDKIFTADYKTDFDPNLPHINVIPQEIGRVLLNIINNAFYACMHNDIPSFGKGMESRKPLVTITTRFIAEESPLFVSNALQKIGKSGRQWIQISIADNGSGIPDDIKDKIFQPFFTTKPTGKGTGLGLSLSYDVIKAHGGELFLESNSEGGATFKILLKKED